MSIEYKFELNVGELVARIDGVTPEALGQAAEHIRQVAAELTPIDTGHLVGSAHVEIDHDQAAIIYPGPYARYQHERLDLRHEHGQAKYLEQPMVTETEKALRIVAEQVQRSL